MFYYTKRTEKKIYKFTNQVGFFGIIGQFIRKVIFDKSARIICLAAPFFLCKDRDYINIISASISYIRIFLWIIFSLHKLR